MCLLAFRAILFTVPSVRKVSTEEVSRGKVSNGKVSNGKVSNGKTSDGKRSNGKVSTEKVSNGKVSNGKVNNGKVSNRKVSTGEISTSVLIPHMCSLEAVSPLFKTSTATCCCLFSNENICHVPVSMLLLFKILTSCTPREKLNEMMQSRNRDLDATVT